MAEKYPHYKTKLTYHISKFVSNGDAVGEYQYEVDVCNYIEDYFLQSWGKIYAKNDGYVKGVGEVLNFLYNKDFYESVAEALCEDDDFMEWLEELHFEDAKEEYLSSLDIN